MQRSGLLRERLRATLTDAYGAGLLSDATLVDRLEVLVAQPLIQPERLVGDLTLRRRVPVWRRRLQAVAHRLAASWPGADRLSPLPILALDWTGATTALTLGRAAGNDVELADLTVSRAHAALWHRDGHWVVEDLGSRNGTYVNGVRVARCELRAGDVVAAGEQRLWID